MNILITNLVLGSIVVASYVPILMDYKNFDYWVGIRNRTPFYIMQILALISFLALSVGFDKTPSLNTSHNFAAFVVFLLFSILWSVLVRLRYVKASAVAVIGAALATIYLIVESFKNTNVPWYIPLSSVVLGAVTVLVDGVGWASRALRKKM